MLSPDKVEKPKTAFDMACEAADAYAKKYGYDIIPASNKYSVLVDRVRYATDASYRLQIRMDKTLRDFADSDVLEGK